ncbi:MAG TPA: recombinase family protein [Planctomycetota bacterium]|nr:recombinase family protein [Planctomycetota bacterium]
MKAIGYVRVSTDGQAQDGVSVEAQQERIKAWALANGYELAAMQIDAGLSGGRADNRPGLQVAIAEACRQKAALVVYSLSRMSRSTKDTIEIGEQLDRAGADLVSLSERIDTTSAAGKMIFRMLAVMAEFERDQISERTKTAMSHMRNQQRRISGRIPYGYDLQADGETLVKNDAEQAVIAIMRDLRRAGSSLTEIAQELQRRGIPTKTGNGVWIHTAVNAILKREGAA